MDTIKRILTNSDYLFTLILSSASNDHSIYDYTIDKICVKIGDNSISPITFLLKESIEEMQEDLSSNVKSFLINIPASTFASTGYMYIKVYMSKSNDLFEDNEENLSTQWIKTNVYYKKE